MPNKFAVLSHYLRYKRRRFHTREDLLRYQERAIRWHLDFVTSHAAFYAPYRGKPLNDYPIMEKPLMMERFNDLNTVGLDREEAMAFALEAERTRAFRPELHGVTVGLSSGTSHSRGLFLISAGEQARWAGYILARCLPHSILKHQTIAFFMRANSNLYEAVGSSVIRFCFYDIYQDMEEHQKALGENLPDVLVGQPSVLLALCEAVRAGTLTISPKRVISIAELLEEADAVQIRETLGVPVIHQVYQCTEGCLATTCSHGTLHLNEDLVHIDRETLDGRRFIPIITDFRRRTQPILRYRLGDILVERAGACSCGSPFTALEKIEGREDDIFLFPGLDKQTVPVYPDFIRRCILLAGEIPRYRVVQEQDGGLVVYTDVDEGLRDRIATEFGRLAEDKGILLPVITFLPYREDTSRKLKRVERLGGISQ